MSTSRIVALAVVAACAGCSIQPFIIEGNYLTYQYAATDNVDAEMRKNAAAICGEHNKIAILTQSACTPSRCATSFQCIDRASAQKDGLLPPATK